MNRKGTAFMLEDFEPKDESNENIVDKKAAEIKDIYQQELPNTTESISTRNFRETSKNNTQQKQIKEKKEENEKLKNFSAAARKILEHEISSSRIKASNMTVESAELLKKMAFFSGVPAYKILASLVEKFYEKHKEEFK